MPMSYAQLTGDKSTPGSLKYMVRHSEIPSEYCLERAQDAIVQTLRVREMIARTEGTIATGASTLAIPSDMLDPISLGRRGPYKGRIAILDQEHFEQRVGEDDTASVYDGTPALCTFDKSLFYFDAKADQDYPYRLWYMQRPAALSAGNQTNFLCDRYGNILEAMAKHYAWTDRNDDEKAAGELQKAMGFIANANGEFDMFKQSIQFEIYWQR
jgi:hypothetical protein